MFDFRPSLALLLAAGLVACSAEPTGTAAIQLASDAASSSDAALVGDAADAGGDAGTTDAGSDDAESGSSGDAGSADVSADAVDVANGDAQDDGSSADAAGQGCSGAADGTTCDDGDACTIGEACVAGVCTGGGPLGCKGNACTTAGCDPAKGCVFVDLDTLCDDGTACTAGDTCKNGLCVGTPVVCDDGNACTTDTCDVGAGCKSAPEVDDVPCGEGSVCYGGACVATGTIFAHTSSALYRLELKKKSFDLVGNFSFDKFSGSVTDIAIDRKDTLYAITFTDLFTCKTNNAKCTWVMKLPQSFNGMTFVPIGTIFADRDALIGIANSGGWYLVDFLGASPTVKSLGSYGGYGSSGDAFSVKGIGTYATVTKAGSSSDLLVSVDPKTGKVLKEIGATGVSGLWGVAWWQGTTYAFASSGSVYSLDLTTGKASALSGFVVPKASWWGAGVSTEAGL